jgi:hypothetical protein
MMETFEVRVTVYYMVEAEDAEDARTQVELTLMDTAHDWDTLEVL